MSVSITPISIVTRKPIGSNDNLVHISTQLFQQLQLEKNSDLNIAIGKQNIAMKVQTMELDRNEIAFPENIIKEFYLPQQTFKFQACYKIESNTLQLGPVIGLLTDFHSVDTEVPHFRSIHAFCEELHHGIAENGGLFYVFPYTEFPNHGYYFDNEKWVPSELPKPDVIYNRVHSRKLEQKKPFKNFRKQLEQLNIPFFNHRFLSKWEVYENLIQEKILQTHIPDTKIFSKENLMDLIEKHETIFIKPIHGSQGRDIIKIALEEENHYSYQTSFQSLSDPIDKNLSLDEVYQQIKPLLSNKIYIIQQGIPLVTIGASAIDFRVLCHKNPHDLWEVTSIVARVSAEKEFVSNLARGGKIMRPVHALQTCMNKREAFEVLARMKELSIETAKILSQHSSGITGELGIDIGVDQEKKVWLIEINSKPSKSYEDGQMKIRPSAKAIIQFCTKLAFE